MTRRRPGFVALALLLGALAALGAAELALRAREGARPSAAVLVPSALPGLVFENRPGIKVELDFVVLKGTSSFEVRRGFYGINALGFRDYKYGREALARPDLVFCLGDSTTFGLGVDFESTYPKQLETMLRKERGRSAFVVNAGVPGYELHQYRANLSRLLGMSKPRAVVVGIFMNDNVPPTPLAGFWFKLKQVSVLAAKWEWWRMSLGRVFGPSESRFMAALRLSLDPESASAIARQISLFGESRFSALELLQTLNDTALWESQLEHLKAMAREAKAAGASTSVLVFPVRHQLLFGYRHPEPQRSILEFCRRHDIPAADLTPVFRREIARGRILYNNPGDGAHFNAYGHELAAREALKLLSRK